MKSNRTIKIFDETLRDGEQQVGVFFDYQSKLTIIQNLKMAGIDFIDVMLSVHESEDRLIEKCTKNGYPLVCACLLSKQEVDKAIKLGIKKIILFYSVSDILIILKKQSQTEVFRQIVDVIKYAYTSGIKIDFAAEDSTRANFNFLVSIGKAIRPYIEYFLICDTVGCLQPEIAYKIVKDFISETGCKVGVHFHNDLGMAVKNTIKGVLAGADLISGTFTGIGERAGNAALEKVLIELKDKHQIIAENFNYNQIDTICKLVKEYGGSEAAKPMSRESLFTESGIHLDALAKNPYSYIIFPRTFPIPYFGKYTGKAGLKYLFEKQNGIELSERDYDNLKTEIKNLSIVEKRSFSGNEIIKMCKEGIFKKFII